jgi:tricorn protease
MKKSFFPVAFLLLICLVLPLSSVAEVDTLDTRLLTQPAISQTHIAFVYANDLWLANLDGKEVRRLTSDLGVESNPRFSPDGKLIAFSAQYDGNTDVYLIPAEGGIPKRLTWHPGMDIVQGFTPDGSSVLFISNRNSANYAAIKLFKVSVQGGFPEELKIPSVFRASYSPDGGRIAYNPLPDAFNQWKHYRGGRISEVWILKISDYSVEKIPQPEGRSNNVGPMWMGDKIYFRSDRNGEFNLFSFDPKTKEIKQLTNHTDFPVLSASAGGGKIIYEQAGYLHICDPETVKSTKLAIGVAADLLELRERYVKGARWVRNASISPSGARAVFEFRGEIITVPAEKGDYRNITNTPGAHERSPIWSPDGKSIAYFSDESGEYELCVKSQDGKGEAKRYKLNSAGFYDSPAWSHDSQKISYADNSWSLYWIDLKTGVSKKIGSEYYYGPARFRTIPSVWSPDSKWIVYTLHTEANIQRVYVYSIEKDKSYPITDGLSEASEPIFDASGKYLYFFASTDAGPIKQWFDLSNADMRMTNVIYVAVLRKDVPSPLAKESDEEKVAQKEEKAKEETKSKNKDKDKKEEQKLAELKKVPGGLLGADFSIENGRYRFKKVFGGLNWNPELRSPLTEPGVDVKEGEYLLAVGGKDSRPPTDVCSMFENTAGKIVEIAVGPNPDGSGSRTVSVVPIADESALRNRDWVEGNLKKVEEATGGRVAYVYVPDTASMGHTYFKRYFFPQAKKDAIIVDERFNGGGFLADYYIDILRRPFLAMWATRYGADIRLPEHLSRGQKSC